MSGSKLQNLGYLQIDHRDSPGLTEAQIEWTGAPIPHNMGRSNFEADVVKCWHCQIMIMLNPLRQRERHMCYGCGRYICDNCNLAYKVSGICKPFLKVIEEIQEAAVKAEFVLRG